MADTIITNTPDRSDGSGVAGWVLAFIIIAALVVGGVILYKKGAFRGGAPSESTNINVSIPNPVNSGGSAE